MKVLYFHQHFKTPNEVGGIRSYEFAKQLIASGHSVTMVCGEMAKFDIPQIRKNMRRGVVDGIDVIQIVLPYSNKDGLIKRIKTFLRYAWVGIKVALKEKYDLIFSTSTPLTAGIPGIVAKVFRRKKFVFEVRDLWPELPKALGMKNPFLLMGMRILEWLSYRTADACIGLSPGICEGIKNRSGKKKNIKLIPNGCDLELFRPSVRELLSLEKIKSTDIVAIYSGTHGIANGLDAVLDVAVQLKKVGREDIVLVFIGDGKVKNHLMSRTTTECLDNCYFYDPIPKKDLSKIVASADIGMMVLANIPAFYYGTSPNKFFDYIASGLPIINNYPGWLANMILKNELGVVVPPNNSEVFAKGLIELADNVELRRKAGSNARRFAEKNFSRKKLSIEFVSFIESVYQSV